MSQSTGVRVPLFTTAVVLIVATLAVTKLVISVESAPGPATFVAAPAGSASSASRPSPSPTPKPTPSPGAIAYKAVSSYLHGRGKHAALAAIDLSTGEAVLYNSTVRFNTASIIKVDILATLLLQHQNKHTSMTSSEKSLAVRMITQSDNNAAIALWHDVGAAAGVRTANKTFKLTGTQPGANGEWGNTVTTAADQLRLLEILAKPDSPLTAASRAYELGLMHKVIPSQRWGVPKAADDDASAVYVKNGWYPFSADHGAWTINSLGEIVESGHTYLIAVLSNGNSSQSSGEKVVAHAATVAVTGLGTS